MKMRLERMQGLYPRKYTWLGLKHSLLQTPCHCSVYASGEALVMSVTHEEVLSVLSGREHESYCLFRDQLLLLHVNVR